MERRGGQEKNGKTGGQEKNGKTGGQEKNGKTGGQEKNGKTGGQEKNGKTGGQEKNGKAGGQEKNGKTGGTGKEWKDGGTGKEWKDGGTGKEWKDGGTGKEWKDGGTGKEWKDGGTGKEWKDGGTGKEWKDGGTGKEWKDGGTGKEWKDGGQEKGGESELSKWDIFYYVYGLLHHPAYRTKYAVNLRRELPRIPISPDFWIISECGHQLADLHVNYEQAAEYPLGEQWAPDSGLNFKVEKMKLRKPVAQASSPVPVPGSKKLKGTGEDAGATISYDIIYNKDLILTGIPKEAFEYRLGNRSAIDWIIDQYQVSTDKRSGITNDPNREDDEMYIVRLLKQVVTVSLETVKIVGEIAKASL